jgi:hypothetical protein
VDIEITTTTANVIALLGWSALLLAAIAALLEVVDGASVPGMLGSTLGLVVGAITVTTAGPLRKVERRTVKLRAPDDNPEG